MEAGLKIAEAAGGLGIPARLSRIRPESPALLIADLAAVRSNYRALRAMARGAECAAVVKANAYGLGAGEIVKALLSEGSNTFFTATLAEARAVRAAAPGAVLYVLGGLFAGTEAEFAALGARPVLNSLAEIGEWALFCAARGEPLPAAIHIDTGMNRLGLGPAEAAALAKDHGAMRAFELSLIMSHLACADEPDHAKNRGQLAAFRTLSAMLPCAPLSLANSAGIFLGPDYHGDLVRPGIALYGGNPFSAAPNPMRPVAYLYGRIAQIREAEAGETVGYGARRTLARRTRIATVPVGYADGYFRALGSSDAAEGAAAYLEDYRLPILGRVSMDLIAFDVTDVPERLAWRGAWIELLGARVTVDALAAKAGAIGYEVLTSLGARYERVYAEGMDGGG